MCHGTYLLSFSCGHVQSTPDICLRDIDPHYRCEPRGMKITQPVGRCVECYARNLFPNEEQHLATSVRFNPYPIEEGRLGSAGRGGGGGSAQVRAILRWVGNVKSLKSLGSRSFRELKEEVWRRREESSSEGSGASFDHGSLRDGSSRLGLDD